jgi:hypothetical protein
MRISAKDGTLKKQPKEFVDMVTNIKPGEIYIHSFPNQIIFYYNEFGVPVPALFYVTEVDDIGTRFSSRDRIVRGYRGREKDGKFIATEKTSCWCSQLADTDKFDGKCEIDLNQVS